MSDQDCQIEELSGKVEALEHVVVTLIAFLGVDMVRRIIHQLHGNPQPRAHNSLKATNALRETLASIGRDLGGPSIRNDD